jgi:hypothetical protein
MVLLVCVLFLSRAIISALALSKKFNLQKKQQLPSYLFIFPWHSAYFVPGFCQLFTTERSLDTALLTCYVHIDNVVPNQRQHDPGSALRFYSDLLLIEIDDSINFVVSALPTHSTRSDMS